MAKKKTKKAEGELIIPTVENLLAPTEYDEEDSALTLNAEIEKLNAYLIQQAENGNQRGVIALIECIDSLRNRQAKIETDAFSRTDILEMAKTYCTLLAETHKGFNAEACFAEVKALLVVGDVETARTSLDDLRLLRRIIRANPDVGTLVTVSHSIRRIVKTASELGLSTGELLSEADCCQFIQNLVRISAKHFSDVSADELGEIIDRFCQEFAKRFVPKTDM